VIAVDTNLLVYAHRTEIIWHDKAKNCLKPLAEGKQPWAIAWPCLHEFIGVVTNKRLHAQPTPLSLAFEQIAFWSSSPPFQFIGEGKDHFAMLQQLCTNASVTGGAIHDARIAAICLEHSVDELWTADRDFSRFPSLKTRNPLVE
jgi:toxin-antitoxin system PIN domain toxin